MATESYYFELPLCLQCKTAVADPRYIDKDGEGFCSAKCEELSYDEYIAQEGFSAVEFTESILRPLEA